MVQEGVEELLFKTLRSCSTLFIHGESDGAFLCQTPTLGARIPRNTDLPAPLRPQLNPLCNDKPLNLLWVALLPLSSVFDLTVCIFCRSVSNHAPCKACSFKTRTVASASLNQHIVL